MRKILTFLILLASAWQVQAQSLTAGDIAIIGVGVDNEEVLMVALANIPAGQSLFITDDEWAGSAFNSGEGFYEWVTPAISEGDVFVWTTSGVTGVTGASQGTVTQRAGSFALGNSGDGVYIYQTSTNVYNSGTYTVIGFAGEDAGDAGTLTGTGLTLGTNAVYFAGDNGVYNGTRTGNDKAGFLALIYDAANWSTSGTAIAFTTTDFTLSGGTLKAEPSNHVSTFAAAANGAFQIDLTWNDNDGAEAADGFLILGKKAAGSYAAVADGSAVSDDSDWSDDNFALNVGSGVQAASITGLDYSTSYDFIIYPYTNSGSNIDFKTAATVPTVSASTGALATLPYSQDFTAAGVPAGWTFTDFTIANSANAGGSANEAELTFSNDNAGTSAVVAEPLNTSGASLLDLSWKQNVVYFTGGSGADYVVKVQTSTDGSSYTDVYTKTVSADETATETIQITAANGAGSANLYIRWLYFSNGNRFSYWRIDDISVATATLPSITASDNSQPTAANLPQGSLDFVLSAFAVASADNDAVLNTVDIDINGTFDANDVDNFQLFYATSNSFGSATQIGSDITGNGNGTSQSLSFSGLSQTIFDASTAYFWVVADVNASADVANTLTAQAPSLSFAAGNLTNNVSSAGTQTIVGATPRAVLADNGTQISTGNVDQSSTNNVLSSFQITISDANADFNGLDITSAGSYLAADVENLKLWYSSDNTFDAGADAQLANIAAPSTAGSQNFSSFNQIITNGSVGYFFITIDFPCAATASNTISVSAIDHTDLSFNGSTNTSGTTSSSGAQTIQDLSPDDVTALSASSGTAQATISWTNPSCFTEVIVVAHTATISGSPSGTYTANSQDYTDGANPSFPTAGKVVYNGTGTTTTITGLSNSTQYFFKVFARKGSNWSSGVEDNATPSSGLAVFINEMSQGSSGSKEWIEIVVTENGTDLRGWDIGDNDDGTYSEFLQFSTSSDWSNLNAGTVIAIYNAADVDGTITPDSDFSDNEVTIASNDATYFSGSWGSFGNSDGDDLAAIRDDNDAIIHDMAVSHPTATISGPGSNQVTYYAGSSSTTSALSDNNNWTTATSTSGTPGSPNGGSNTTWIQSLRPAPGATPNPSALSIDSYTATTFDISWTKPSGVFGTDWDGVLVFVSNGSNGIDLSASGQDGIDYTANLAYASGTFATDAGANDNAYCVANQTTDLDGSITVTGLSTGTTYYVYAYAYKEVTGNNDDDEFSSQVSGGNATPANLPSAGDIVITEIMYNSSNSGSDDEWVEIYNNSGSAISMSNSWRLTYDNNTFDFGSFTFNAGAYYTIALGSGGDGEFNSGNPFTPDTNALNVLNSAVAATSSSNFLTNSSDPITIVYEPGGANVTIDAVTYSTSSPWPSGANGSGPSLSLKDPASDNSQGANWRASFGTGGTPGTDTLTALVYNAGAWNATDVPNAATGGLNATVKTGESVSIASDAAIANLTIEASAVLTISAGNVLTVNGDIANNNSLVIESAASLLQTKASDANSGTGTYSASREFSARNHTRFSMWSSPMSDEDIDDAFSGSNASDLYEFDAANQSWSAYSTGLMNAGQGYAATPSLNPGVTDFTDTKTFVGTINNGSVSFSVSSVSASDYILIGNPYPSGLDFAAFAAANTDILPTAYYWDASPAAKGDAQYASWNASGQTTAPNSQRNSPSSTARAMQGFFVQVDPAYSGSGTINFSFQNSMRLGSGNTNAGFFKTETRERAWFNLSTDSAANQILMMFDDRASNGFDRMFDAPIYKANQFHSFYSIQDSMEYSIQGVPYIQPGTARVMPLGVDAWYQGVYTISLDSLNNWDANNAIVLVDSLTGSKVDLRQQDYQFSVSQTGAIQNRLYIVFGTESNVGLIENTWTDFYIYQDAKSDLVISDENKLGFTAIEVRNLGGQLIYCGDLDAQNSKHYLSTEAFTTGVYLIKLTDRSQATHNQKVLIK